MLRKLDENLWVAEQPLKAVPWTQSPEGSSASSSPTTSWSTTPPRPSARPTSVGPSRPRARAATSPATAYDVQSRRLSVGFTEREWSDETS